MRRAKAEKAAEKAAERLVGHEVLVQQKVNGRGKVRAFYLYSPVVSTKHVMVLIRQSALQ